jgi:molybdate transport system substrate-binding protein
MKKLTELLLSAMLLLSVTGCASDKPAEETTVAQTESVSLSSTAETIKGVSVEAKEITVFAAASLTESLNKIKGKYEAENPGITLVFNFDSSGSLKTQVERAQSLTYLFQQLQSRLTA